jgi:hypothetical protein
MPVGPIGGLGCRPMVSSDLTSRCLSYSLREVLWLEVVCGMGPSCTGHPVGVLVKGCAWPGTWTKQAAMS